MLLLPFLGDFRGYVQADGYVGYDFLDTILMLANKKGKYSG